MPNSPSTPPPGSFATTHWSVVLGAASPDPPRSQAALEAFCKAYWYPLYSYVRRRGYSTEDAQDLTQQFFERLLDRKLFERADPAKGRFRNFLLAAMDHFVTNEWKKAHAQKRGGLLPPIPIQVDEAESRYGVEPADERTPEQAFEYNWALALLDEVMRKLEQEYRTRGHEKLFAALKPCIVASPAAEAVADLTAGLGMNEGAIRVAVHRLRCRYRELLREEIGATVDSPLEVDAEMRHLFKVLSRQ